MKDGLGPALHELLDKSLNNCDLRIPSETRRLDNDLEINVYRIAQELVNNIVKHAEADHVSAELLMKDRHLTFTMRDNGRGFDPSFNKEGVGLTNIYTRTELIGGEVMIRSKPGEGTFVQLKVPA
jgi:signal transduction histidine kinase